MDNANAFALLCSELAYHGLGPELEPAPSGVLPSQGIRVADANGECPLVYEVIRAILSAHAIEGEGRCAGGVEFYPLAGGLVFSVVWIENYETGDRSARLEIAGNGGIAY